MTDEAPITVAELRRELDDTEESLTSLLDCVVTMTSNFLPDHVDDLTAEAATLRRTIRLARQYLDEGA
jgi:hypothetical protein